VVEQTEQQDLTIWTEFFNTHVAAVDHVYGTNPRDGLASRGLIVRHDGRVLGNSKQVAPAYLAIDSRQSLVGTPLARFALSTIEPQSESRASLTLWRVALPLRFGPLRLPPHTSAHGINLIPNGGFETEGNGWDGNAGTETIQRTTVHRAFGSASLRVDTTGRRFSGIYLSTRTPVKAHTNYAFSFYVRAETSERIIPTVEWFEGESLTRTDQPIGNPASRAWRLMKFDVTSPTNSDYARVAIVLSGAPKTSIYVDSAKLLVGGPGDTCR
jgi:hypothetical protein